MSKRYMRYVSDYVDENCLNLIKIKMVLWRLSNDNNGDKIEKIRYEVRLRRGNKVLDTVLIDINRDKLFAGVEGQKVMTIDTVMDYAYFIIDSTASPDIFMVHAYSNDWYDPAKVPIDFQITRSDIEEIINDYTYIFRKLKN